MKVESLAEKLLYTTVRIDTQTQDGRSGSGTGFVYIYQSDEQNIPVVVTNKHVVESFPKGSITFSAREGDQPKEGAGFKLEIEDFSNAWTGHPTEGVDVAVIPLVPLENRINELGTEIYYQAISKDIIPSEEQIEGLDAFEELVFIGYPNGIWDKKNLLPVMRTGTTGTPMVVDFEGNPTFLMDASVFPGSSGSPVFLYNPGMYYSKSGSTTVGTRLFFVGVVAAVFFRNDMHDIVSIPIPTTNQKAVAISKEMIDLGIVYKAHTVAETVEHLIEVRGRP